MTITEHISKLKNATLQIKENAVAIAAQDTHVKMVDRIFVDGHNANDGDIGSYSSTGELYLNPKNAPRNFPSAGKTGNTKFSNGNSHKTGFFESYKNYRNTLGRKTDKVNLVMFGNLQSDFGKGVIKLDGLSYASTVTREDSKNKIEGAEAKYGPIFRLTPTERTNFKQVLAFEIFEALK